MNGSIQPTVELATNNGTGFYPYMYGNNSGFFGDNGIWAILLLALLWGGNGFGGFGGNGWNNVATTDYVSSEFTQRDINNGFQNQSNLISNGFTNLAQDVCNLKSDVLENRYASQLSACNTQRDILTQTNELNTNLLTQALQNQAHMDACCCDIKSLIREDGEKTRDLITQNTIQDLRDRLTAAQDVISDQRTEASIVNSLRPYPVPAYLTGSPYVGFNNAFYGNGFYGNTIV